MYLNAAEKKMYGGEMGPSLKKAMDILVAIGEIYDAPRLIDVRSVHISGISYRSAGEVALQLADEFASSGNKFVVPTSSNIICIDRTGRTKLNFPADFVRNQKRMLKIYERMGIIPTHTCTPYYSGCVPICGQHIAWSESSSLIFANSVIGAWTNRESNPTAISSALTGKTPLYGYHIKENRAGTVLVEVTCDIKASEGYSALGFCVGSKIGSHVPVFSFNKSKPNTDNLKSLGASLATSGDVGLFHVVGVTPEALNQEMAFQGHKPAEKLSVGENDLRKVFEQFSKKRGRTIDHVMIGCPHASITELREVADLLTGKKISINVNTWICTSFAVKCLAERMGVVERIERSGAHVLADTCTVAAPTKQMGCDNMATNSIKAAKYGSEKNDMSVVVGSIKQVVQSAIEGEWSEFLWP